MMKTLPCVFTIFACRPWMNLAQQTWGPWCAASTILHGKWEHLQIVLTSATAQDQEILAWDVLLDMHTCIIYDNMHVQTPFNDCASQKTSPDLALLCLQAAFNMELWPKNKNMVVIHPTCFINAHPLHVLDQVN